MAHFDEEIRNRRLKRASSSSSSISVPDSWSNFDAFSPNNIKVHDYSESMLSSKDSTFDSSSIVSSKNLTSLIGKPPTRTPSKFKKLAENPLGRDIDHFQTSSFSRQISTFSEHTIAHSDRSHYGKHLGLV